MESEEKKFGRGPKELTGAVDLISHCKLLPHHEFFCKKPLPVFIAETHYLHNVVGDTEIRKGEGMQLDQLIQDPSYSQDRNVRILPFDLDVLREAFHLRDSAPVELPPGEKGVPTVAAKSKSESKDKEKKHKKHKDRDKDKDKEHKKHKHRHKDRSKDKDKKKDKSGHQDSGADQTKKHHDKKRKHDGNEDVNDIQDMKRVRSSEFQGPLSSLERAILAENVYEMISFAITSDARWKLFYPFYRINSAFILDLEPVKSIAGGLLILRFINKTSMYLVNLIEMRIDNTLNITVKRVILTFQFYT
ncbi:hypothetical protein V2J09_022072 [Rumex salicifolius]